MGDTGWCLHLLLAAYNIGITFTHFIATMQVPSVRDARLSVGKGMATARTQNLRETILRTLDRKYAYIRIPDRGAAFAGILLSLFFTKVTVLDHPDSRPFLQLFAYVFGYELGVIAFLTPWLFKPSCALVNRVVEIKKKPRAG